MRIARKIGHLAAMLVGYWAILVVSRGLWNLMMDGHWPPMIGSTATWASQGMIYICAAISCLAVLASVRTGLLTVVGYLLGIVLGDVIGLPVYEYLREQRRMGTLGPGDVHHPGWFIFMVTFLAFPLLAQGVVWIRSSGEEPHPNQQPEAAQVQPPTPPTVT